MHTHRTYENGCLRALERGDRLTHIAQRFEVSRVWVYQVRTRLNEHGHRKSRLADMEETLRAWLTAQPDLTLNGAVFLHYILECV